MIRGVSRERRRRQGFFRADRRSMTRPTPAKSPLWGGRVRSRWGKMSGSHHCS